MSTLKPSKLLYVGESIPLHSVIVFPQVRVTFEPTELQELANDIAHGVLQPSICAKLSFEKFQDYKKVFERISGVMLGDVSSFPSVKKEGKYWYYCLIAGERRFRALCLLWDKGCTNCQEEATVFGKILKPGECYQRHFNGNYMDIRSCLEIDPLSAKSIQFRENNYVKPPIYEEAHALEEFFTYLRLDNPKLSFKQFAQIVGASIEKVRKALWYCELPARVQEAVKKKVVTYSNSLEFKRLQDLPDKKRAENLIDQELTYLLLHPRVKHSDYRSRVTNIIEESQVATLFDTAAHTVNKKQKRRVVQQHIIPYLVLFQTYLSKIVLLQQVGQLGQGKIFSGLSPNRQVINVVHYLQLIIPGFTLTKRQEDALRGMNLDQENGQAA